LSAPFQRGGLVAGRHDVRPGGEIDGAAESSARDLHPDPARGRIGHQFDLQREAAAHEPDRDLDDGVEVRRVLHDHIKDVGQAPPDLFGIGDERPDRRLVGGNPFLAAVRQVHARAS